MQLAGYYVGLVVDIVDSSFVDAEADQKPVPPCSEHNLQLLREVQPVLLLATESQSDWFALTSTCRQLHKRRWEWIFCHPVAIHNVFTAALARDTRGESWYSWFFEEAKEELTNVENILRVSEQKWYATKFFLKMPLGGIINQHIIVSLMDRIREKFPQATIVEEENPSERRDSLFFSFGCT